MIGPGAVANYPLTLDLKFDAAGAVTGTAKGGGGETAKLTGTFDSKTAAFKMVAELAADSTTSRMTFDGMLVLDTITGRLTPSDKPVPGVFVLKKTAAGAAAPAGGGDAHAAVRFGFTEVSGWVTKAADLVPADKYAYQPAKTVRTFGQLIAHIADGSNFYCGRAAGKKVEWSDAIANGKTDKATVLPKLKEALAGCNAAYDAGRIDQLMANVAHTNLHYGNIVTYMRMLGLVPPSS
jgi:uncharacterized damage-inducible protein DinB